MTGTAVRARLPRPAPAVLDTGIAAALVAVTAVDLALRDLQPGQHSTDAGAYLLALAMAAPYVVHRRRPLEAMVVTVTALTVYALLHYSAFPGLVLFTLLFGISLHVGRRRSAIAAALAAGAMALALAVQPAGVTDSSTWASSELAVAVCWLGARNLRQRRARWEAMAERSRALEREREERDRRAVVAERLRIARELHDVVAHSMSVIAVQSGVGRHVIDTDPDAARRALAAIETTSRAALTEMRRMLGVLRQDGGSAAGMSDSGLMPAPGLADVALLAEQVGRAGVTVSLELSGSADQVPAGVGLSAFRIVQEALTNVAKHGGSLASVRIVCDAAEVRVEVEDPGRGPAGNGAVGVPRSEADPAPAGILGMRERAAVTGGQFSATPRPGGGFRVAARLPFAGAPR
jgi:signal transduction histidine kinase